MKKWSKYAQARQPPRWHSQPQTIFHQSQSALKRHRNTPWVMVSLPVIHVNLWTDKIQFKANMERHTYKMALCLIREGEPTILGSCSESAQNVTSVFILKSDLLERKDNSLVSVNTHILCTCLMFACTVLLFYTSVIESDFS